jgi:hypothetical protein
MEITSFRISREPRLGWSSHQRNTNPNKIHHSRFKHHRNKKHYTTIDKGIHCLAKVWSSSPGWIIGTLSEEAFGLVIGLDTTLAVWEALKDAYAQDSQEREFTLRQQLTYLRKDENRTIGDHICIFKGLCYNLAGIGKPLPDKEKVFLPSHKSRTVIWNLYNNDVETTKTNLHWTDFTVAKPGSTS